jgi:hypothetical protein
MATKHFAGAMVVTLGAAGMLLNCAGGNPPDNDNDDGATTTTVSAGGSGGVGQGGAMGGSGGQPGLCAQDCTAINTPQCLKGVCNDGQYQGVIGECVIVPDEGVSCDDGEFCTIDDLCDDNGVCVGGPPNDCGMMPLACELVTCDEAADSCGTMPAPVGSMCDPGDLCVGGATCNSAVQCTGFVNDCFFAPVPNECHIAVCNPMNGMCEPVADPTKDGDPCNDSMDLCTVNKTCDTMGNCGGGSPKDCSNLTQGCDLGICDTTNGQCFAMTVMNGQMCDDLDGCTVGETCNNGNCAGGTPVTTCSGGSTADGCCPSSCNATNDLDCAICTVDWDNATLQGWTVTASCPSQNNWQPDSFRHQAGTHSLYYGNPALHNFVCSNGAHNGTATSKYINLQPGAPNVTFWVWIATEGGTTYDQLDLWVMPANVEVWDRNDFPQGALGDTGGVFIQQTVDLTPWAGQSIQLQFRFNTVDGVANSEEGVYIDSLVAQGNCP